MTEVILELLGGIMKWPGEVFILVGSMTFLFVVAPVCVLYDIHQRSKVRPQDTPPPPAEIKSVPTAIAAHTISSFPSPSSPPPKPHHMMVSNVKAAHMLESWIRRCGDSRWLHKEMIQWEYFEPMCEFHRVTVRSWEGVYRALCKQIFAEKMRIYIGSNEDYEYLWDYDLKPYPYLVRVATQEEVDKVQAGKVSTYLAQSRRGQEYPPLSRIPQKQRRPAKKKLKPLAAQQNTWTNVDMSGLKVAA